MRKPGTVRATARGSPGTTLDALLAAAVMLTAAVVPAGPATAAEADYAAALTGPAAPALAAYLRTARIPCADPRGETTCTPAARAYAAQVHYGRFPDDPADYVVAFLTWQYDQSGNAEEQMAVVLKTVPGGGWAPVGIAPHTVGTRPRELRFSGRMISYVGTVLGPNDARADPQGRATYRLEITHQGVRFVQPSGSPPALTPEELARRIRRGN